MLQNFDAAENIVAAFSIIKLTVKYSQRLQVILLPYSYLSNKRASLNKRAQAQILQYLIKVHNIINVHTFKKPQNICIKYFRNK